MLSAIWENWHYSNGPKWSGLPAYRGRPFTPRCCAPNFRAQSKPELGRSLGGRKTLPVGWNLAPLARAGKAVSDGLIPA